MVRIYGYQVRRSSVSLIRRRAISAHRSGSFTSFLSANIQFLIHGIGLY